MLEEIRANLKAGRTAVYDADLKSYFDTIPHHKPMACVRMRVTDSAVLGLIRGWLHAPVIETDGQTGKPMPPRKSNGQGTPQGEVISPLLANVYLHEFDRRIHRYDGPSHWANARLVRYADDSDELLAGKPDAGNPQVRSDEGEQRTWRKPPVALSSTGKSGSEHLCHFPF